jgi:hypothetical protein
MSTMKSTLILLAALLLAPLAVLHAANPTAFTLVENGQAKGAIYLAPGSTPTASYAAEELRDHIALATGVRLPIVDKVPTDSTTPMVLVGPSEAAEARGVSAKGLKLEEHRIKTGPNWLVLLGDDTAGTPFQSLKGAKAAKRGGTLLAVYRWLEDTLGVRWFMPGELGTVVPPADRVEVAATDISATPALQIRQHGLFETRGKGGPETEPDSELGRWYLRARFGRATETFFNHTFHYLTGGESWAAFGKAYAKKMNYRETKPHIFAVLPNGERDFDTTSYGMGNLCLSEPDTLTEFVKLVRSQFDNKPDLKEFTVWPNDVWVPCTCDKCLSALDPTLHKRLRETMKVEKAQDGSTRAVLPPELMTEFRAASGKTLARFHVEVARQLYQSHPDRLIGAVSYMGSGDPDNYLEFAPLPPNIAFMFAKTRCDFWNRQKQAECYDLVRRARKVTNNLHAWEYHIWARRPWGSRPRITGYPVFFPSILAEDTRFMHEQGLVGEYAGWDSLPVAPGLEHLTSYLTGKLLFDPTLDIHALLEDYYAKFFGAARDEMKAFWQHAETCWMRDTSGLDRQADGDKIIETLYTAEDLSRFYGLLAAAKAKVATGSKEYQRIALIEQEMSVNRKRLVSGVELPPSWGAWMFRWDPNDQGVKQDWAAAEPTEAGGWQSVEVPALLTKTKAGSSIGYGWYATTFSVPESSRGCDLRLVFGSVDEQAWIYVNGKKVGEHSVASEGKPIAVLYDAAFEVTVPSSVLDASGKNRLAVRIHNSAGDSGITGKIRLLEPASAKIQQFQSSAVFPAPPLDARFQEEWKGGNLTLSDATTGRTAVPSTTVKVAHDAQHLYLNFKATEDGTAPLPAAVDGKAWTWADKNRRYLPLGASNSLLIQLQPDPAKAERQAAIMVNASGKTFAALYGDPKVTDPAKWESGVKAATQIAAGGWTGTIIIPWKSLGLQLSPGMEIKANVTRFRAGKEPTMWSSGPTPKPKPGHQHLGSLFFPEE